MAENAPPGVPLKRYRFNSPRAGIRELLSFVPAAQRWWKFPVVLLKRDLRIRVPISCDIPLVEPLPALSPSAERLPEDVRATLAPLLAEVAALGFVELGFSEAIDVWSNTCLHWLVLRHRSRHEIAIVTHRLFNGAAPPDLHISFSYLNGLSDGSFLVSSPKGPGLVPPPSVRCVFHPGAGPARLWEEHLRELARLRGGKPSIDVASRGGAAQLFERYHATILLAFVARGLLLPCASPEPQISPSVAPQQLALGSAPVQAAQPVAAERVLLPSEVAAEPPTPVQAAPAKRVLLPSEVAAEPPAPPPLARIWGQPPLSALPTSARPWAILAAAALVTLLVQLTFGP